MARRFTVDSEGSLPAWYSASLLLAAGGLLGITAAVAFRQRDSWWKHWTALAGLFCLLSLDEAACFHEAFILPMQKHYGASGLLFFAWVVPGAGFVLLTGLAFLNFVRNLDPPTRNRFILSGTVFVGGALGLEVVGGAFFDRFGEQHVLYIFTAACEEGCEIFGLTFFVIAISQHLGPRVGELRLRFGTDCAGEETEREIAPVELLELIRSGAGSGSGFEPAFREVDSAVFPHPGTGTPCDGSGFDESGSAAAEQPVGEVRG